MLYNTEPLDAACYIFHVFKCGYVTSSDNGWGGDFLSGDQEVTMDDKSAVKAKGLWEDWHMRQAVDQAVRANHRSGIDHPFKLYNQICLLQFSSIIFSLRSTYGRDICT